MVASVLLPFLAPETPVVAPSSSIRFTAAVVREEANLAFTQKLLQTTLPQAGVHSDISENPEPKS